MKAIGKIVCFQGKKQSLSPQNFQRGTIVSTAREYWAGYRLYGEDEKKGVKQSCQIFGRV